MDNLINGVTEAVEINEKYKGKTIAWGDSPKKTKTKRNSPKKTKRNKTKKTRTKPHPPSYSRPKSNDGRAGSLNMWSKSQYLKTKRQNQKKHTLNKKNGIQMTILDNILKRHNILNEIIRSQNSKEAFKKK